jgi:hypothetical protein
MVEGKTRTGLLQLTTGSGPRSTRGITARRFRHSARAGQHGGRFVSRLPLSVAVNSSQAGRCPRDGLRPRAGPRAAAGSGPTCTSDAGIDTTIGCHTFRATGITDYLTNGGRIEVAQRMAGHSSAKTTALDDRRNDDVSVGEVERIGI